jgi:hypothetical protein
MGEKTMSYYMLQKEKTMKRHEKNEEALAKETLDTLDLQNILSCHMTRLLELKKLHAPESSK